MIAVMILMGVGAITAQAMMFIEAEAILIGAAHQIAALQIQARNMSYTRIAAILVMARGAATIAQTIM